jgi:sugar lactone lactonase YvrE
MDNRTATVFDNTKYALGESPFYDPRYKRYSWVDIIRNRFYRMSGDGEKRCFDLGQPIGAAVPLKDAKGYLLAARDGLYKLEHGNAELVCELNSVFKPYWRCNDAKADPKGRVFFGASVVDDHEAEGALFSYDSGKVTCLQPGTRIANGMAWSSDRKSFFFSDSLEYAVFKYDYNEADGSIANRQVLFTIEDGVPDGMCIDSEDNLYVAVWGGRRIEIHSGRTGEKLGVISVPAEHVTSCCFGGDDLKTLFITSSGDGLEGEYDGCIFKCTLDVAGVEPDLALLPSNN